MEREVTCWGKVTMIFIFKFSTRSDWPCNSYVAIKLVSIVISLMGDFGSLVDLFSIAFTKTDCCLYTGQILLEHTHEFYSFWNVHPTMSNYSSTRLLEKRHECSRLFYVLGTLVMSVMTILGGFTSSHGTVVKTLVLQAGDGGFDSRRSHKFYTFYWYWDGAHSASWLNE